MTQKYDVLTELFSMLGSYNRSAKYQLVPSEKENLFRIKALRSFGDVKVGDIGGLVSGENNLSHNGTCWVYDDAQVTGKAKVTAGAQIRDNARVEENAEIGGYAKVSGNSLITNKARVKAFSRVKDNAHIGGNALIEHCATVFGHARIEDNAKLGGYVNIGGDARICADSRIGYEKNSPGYTIANKNHSEMITCGDYRERKKIDWPAPT